MPTLLNVRTQSHSAELNLKKKTMKFLAILLLRSPIFHDLKSSLLTTVSSTNREFLIAFPKTINLPAI